MYLSYDLSVGGTTKIVHIPSNDVTTAKLSNITYTLIINDLPSEISHEVNEGKIKLYAMRNYSDLVRQFITELKQLYIAAIGTEPIIVDSEWVVHYEELNTYQINDRTRLISCKRGRNNGY